MAASFFQDLMTDIAIPALQDIFGVAATHTDADGVDTAVVVMLATAVEPVGEFGERMEARTTLEIPAASGAVVGDLFTIAGTATDDDPDPLPVDWQATQLLADDGLLRKFAVRAVTAAADA